MKKILSSIICLLVVASLALCITGCDLISDLGSAVGITSIAGTYQMVEMVSEDMTITREDLESMAQLSDMDPDEICYLILNDDGTGFICLMGEEMDMAYADGEIWPVDAPDEKVPFTVSGNTLTIEQDGAKMVFKK